MAELAISGFGSPCAIGRETSPDAGKQNVRLYRKLSRLTQEKLAEKAALVPSYISDVERGMENISVDALHRIARALKVCLENLCKRHLGRSVPV